MVADDLDDDDGQRWPEFAPRAVEAGYRGLMSTQLSVNSGVRAALNLYSAAPHAFDEEAQTLAGLFGIQASILLYGAETAAQLQRAVDSRDLIGQAKGILMERHRLSADQAFSVLVRASQQTNVKLRALAEHLTRTGELPSR